MSETINLPGIIIFGVPSVPTTPGILAMAEALLR